MELDEEELLDGTHQINWDDLEIDEEPLDENKDYGRVFTGCWFGRAVRIRLLAEFGDEENVAESLRTAKRELKMLSTTPHPQIVQFLGGCIKSRKVFIVTELLSNSLELFTLLRSEGSNFTWEKKLKVALSIITALRFLHTKKMIYRNLNTKNIWVDSNWRVKLSELGFVKTDTATNGKTPRRGYEDLGMAPEILRGEEYSGKADVFSFGVVLYEIITVAEVPARNMSTNFGFEMEDISKELQKVSGCPGPLRSLTLQCLEGVPDDRPEARTVVMILKDFVASHSEGGPQKTTPSDQNAAFPSTTIRSENLTEVEPNPAKNHSPSTAIGTTSSLGSTEISGAGGRNVQNSVSPHLEGKPAGEKEIAKAPLERKEKGKAKRRDEERDEKGDPLKDQHEVSHDEKVSANQVEEEEDLQKASASLEGDGKAWRGIEAKEAIRRALDDKWNVKLVAAKNLQREIELDLLAATFQCRIGRGTMKEKERSKDKPLPKEGESEEGRKKKEVEEDEKRNNGKKCILM